MNEDDLQTDVYLTLVTRYLALREADLAAPPLLMLTAPVVHDEVDEDFLSRITESSLFDALSSEGAGWLARDHLHALALAGLLDLVPWPLPETPGLGATDAFRVFDQALAQRVGLNRALFRLARATALDGAQVAALTHERPVDLFAAALPLLEAVSRDADLRLYLSVMLKEDRAAPFLEGWERLTAEPLLLAAHLAQPPGERSALDRTLLGLLAFLRLCERLERFVSRNDLPHLLRAVVWTCHAALFSREASSTGLAERLEAQSWAALGQSERWAREDFLNAGSTAGVWAGLRRHRAALGRCFTPPDAALSGALARVVSELGIR